MSCGEKALISRAVSHPSGPAFSELVKKHQSALRYSLRQMTGWDESLADDIAQETFIKAFRSLPSFRGDAKFSTWLYRIASNLLTSQYRKRVESITEDGKTPEIEISPENDTDLHRDIAQAMRVLSIEQRIALHLSLYKECSHSEVAEIMGCPLGTAKSHIQRGREKLQQALNDWRPSSTFT